MIVFITAHDGPTSDNLIVAGHVADAAAVPLRGLDAVREGLITALEADGGEPLLAMCHGSPAMLLGNDGEAALTKADLAALGTRESFALACRTSEGLGPAVAAAGGTWFGYSGPINCLPTAEEVRPHFAGVVDFIVARFPGCREAAPAQAFIDDLDALTAAAFTAIEPIAGFEELHALRDITRRLRVWLPNETHVLAHPEASPEPVFGP